MHLQAEVAAGMVEEVQEHNIVTQQIIVPILVEVQDMSIPHQLHQTIHQETN